MRREPTDHWYVLYTTVTNQERACTMLRKEGLNVFLPKMEYYRRDRKAIETKVMFPGYLFIHEQLDQESLDQRLEQIRQTHVSLPRQLKEEGTNALRPDEIEMFTNLLDDTGLMRMSSAYLKDGKAVVTAGPLLHYQDNIIKADRHNRLVWLDLSFMDKHLQAGLEIHQRQKLQQEIPSGKSHKKKQKSKQKPPKKPDQKNSQSQALEEQGFLEINLEELKSKMMGL